MFLSAEPLRVRMHYRARDTKPLVNRRVSLAVDNWGRMYFLASTELHTDDCLTLAPEGFNDCIVDEHPLSLGTYDLTAFLELNGVIQDCIEAAATLQVENGNFYGNGKDYPRGWEGRTVLVKHRWEVPTQSAIHVTNSPLDHQAVRGSLRTRRHPGRMSTAAHMGNTSVRGHE